MRVEVLLSCMRQDGRAMIERSNIETDVVIVNQCDVEGREEFEFKNRMGEVCRARIVNTKERGLSRSRNMAMREARGDVCLFADDDEVFVEGYGRAIVAEYERYRDVDMIAFKMDYVRKRMPGKLRKIGRLMTSTLASPQISFLRDRVMPTGIVFDEKMGSGSGNGGGEENKFLWDLVGAGLRMIYVPTLIVRVGDGESQWFTGYDEKYFTDKGWSLRRTYGWFGGLFFIWALLFKHFARHQRAEGSINFFARICYFHKGYFQKR